jgi:hypothetical protein
LIIDARNDGYIQDTGIPWKHVYKLNKLLKIGGNMSFMNNTNMSQSHVSDTKTELESKDSVVVPPMEQPNQRYKIRYSTGDFYCNDTSEKTTELKGQLEGIFFNERRSEGANFNITEFWIVLIDETEKKQIIAYGEDGSISVQDLVNRCCNIKEPEELNIKLSLYEHQVGYRTFINGMVRRLGDFKEIEPKKLYYDLPDGMQGKIEFYKAEIEKLNARIRDWN